MAMFKTIVLGLDGSENSKRAVPAAVELARMGGGRIVIAHVDERVAGKGGVVSLRADEPDIREDIQAEADRISAEGVDATVENASSVLGGPAQSIAEIADEADADLIVVGTRGHSPIPGLLLGSVTNRLLHISKRPVLGIPPSD
jgi:nucleotide-binding universal stress UspA family protein